MNTSTAPVPGVFHFLQHRNVSSQDWQALCQAITTAYLKLHWQPDTLGLTTAPVICEHTGKRLYRFDNNLMGLGMLGLTLSGLPIRQAIRLSSTSARHPMP